MEQAKAEMMQAKEEMQKAKAEMEQAKAELEKEGCKVTQVYSEKSIMIADPFGMKFHIWSS